MLANESGDRILVSRARSGDPAAFEALVRRHARSAHSVALSVLANHADAQDICQDAWVRALERLEDCRDPDRFAGWFLQIVRNLARNHLQYRRVRVAEEIDQVFGPEGPPGRDDPLRELRGERQRAVLERALARVPAAQAEVLLLHDLAGLRHRAIAEMLGISENLCRQRLFQARARMRALLGQSTQGRFDEL